MLGSKRGRQSPSPSPYAVGRGESEDSWLHRSTSDSPAVWSSAKKSRAGEEDQEEQEKEVLNMSASELAQSFHLEESLIIAEGNRDRYKIELEAEMDRSAVLAGRIAQLETENAHLSEQARASAEAAAAKEKELRAEISAGESKGRASQLEAAKIGVDDEKLKLQDQVRSLREALSQAEEERDLAKEAASAAEARASVLSQRCEEAQQEAKENLLRSLAPGAASDAEERARQKLEDLQTVVRHQSSALDSARAEAREVAELRKVAKRLRGIKEEAQEAKERVGRLESMLHNMVQAEAKLRQERDALQDWKVTLAVGLRDSSTPSDVIDAFKALREHNLVLEGQLATWQEKAKHLEREAKESEEGRKGEEGARQRAEAERDSLRSALVLEEGKVEREKREAQQLQLLLGSYKVEEVLVRDLTVQELKNKVADGEQKMAKTKEELEGERAKAKASADKLQAELTKVKEELAKTKEELAKTKEELAKTSADLTKANADLQKSRAECTSTREQLRKESNAAAVEKRTLMKVKEEAEKKAKEVEEERKAKEEEKKAKEEAETELKAAKESNEKLQEERQETRDKLKKHTDLLIKEKKKTTAFEDFEKIFPCLFGFSYKCQVGKPTPEKDRVLIIQLKRSFAEEGKPFIILKGKMSADAKITPTIEISGLADDLKSEKEKFVDGSVQTAAKHVGVPAFLASLVGADFERLVQEKREPPAAQETGGGAKPADGTASPVLVKAEGGVQTSEARAGSKSPVLAPGSGPS